jgi:8-amino-7-oxononanoate synthase
MINAFLDARLQKRKDEGILRSLPLIQGLLDLTSNDYFGFANALDLQNKASRKADRIGATGSRLLTGNHPFYGELEEKIAYFHRAESCLLFNTGYTANLGLIAALGMEDVTFLYDLEIHASMIDGMRLSKAKSIPFRHNDLSSLERKLKEASLPIFVLAESIYSISGDFAPLKDIVSLCSQYGAALIVDEAHATGVCGPNGRGYVAELGLESQVFARIHTFSKALGSHGACVLGSQTLKKYLINFSRPFIYTTALPLPALFLIEAGYEKLESEAQSYQQRLKTLVIYFQEKSGIHESQSPIQPIYISGTERVRHLSKKLMEQGLDVRAMVAPTTKRGRECLRVVLHSFNREEEIDKLVEVLR